MNREIASSLLVMFVAIAFAAICQEFVAPVTALRLKLPCLLAVVVYYGQRRQTGYAVAAAIWCGLLQDGLDYAGSGVGLFTFGIVAAFCIFVGKQQLPDNTVSCVLIGLLGGFLLVVFQYIGLRRGGHLAELPVVFLLTRIASATVLAGLVTGAGAAFMRGLDYLSANVGLEDEGDSFSWGAS